MSSGDRGIKGLGARRKPVNAAAFRQFSLLNYAKLRRTDRKAVSLWMAVAHKNPKQPSAGSGNVCQYAERKWPKTQWVK